MPTWGNGLGRTVKYTGAWVGRMNQTWPVRKFGFQRQSADPVSVALAAYVPPKRLDPPTKLYGVKTHNTSLNTDPLKTKINLKYIQRPSPYRAVNTLRLGYKNQSVNVV